MHKEISIIVSDTLVTASVQGRRESSTVIAASKEDEDILESAKNAIDDVFMVIRTNDEAEKPITAMVIIGDKAYRCYGRVDIENMHVKNLARKPDVIKRKFTLVEI